MSTKYNIDITNEVTNHFNQVLKQYNSNNNTVKLQHVKKMLGQLKDSKEEYVLMHIEPLNQMLQIYSDNQWQMTQQTKNTIYAAFSYLLQEDDLIPDTIPVIGLLDDCIVIDIAINKIYQELTSFRDFSRCRTVYAKGKQFAVNDWSKIKKFEATSHLRNRRNRRNSLSNLLR